MKTWSNMNAEKLIILPCPCCGGTDVLPHSIEGTTCFCCIGCGLASDYKKDAREALAAWNRRTLSQITKIIKIYGTELYALPCPFCGSVHLYPHQLIDMTFLFCTDCRAVAGGKDINASLTVWNLRAQVENSEKLEVCERCLVGDLKWADGIIHARVCEKCFWELTRGKNGN